MEHRRGVNLDAPPTNQLTPQMETNWEEKYQRNETPWNKGNPCPGLVEFLQNNPVTGRVLVPGCGFGHDVRALALTADQVLGIDLAPSAIHAAKSFPPEGGEDYSCLDLFALPLDFCGSFAWVWEHTCFCAINPQRRPDYVRAVASALQPNGYLLAIFYLNPDNDQPEGEPPFGTSPDELHQLFGSHFQLIRSWTPIANYPGREGRELMQLLQRKPELPSIS